MTEQPFNPAHVTVARVLECIADGFLSLDGGWRVLVANARCGELLGHPLDTLPGAHLWTELGLGPGDALFDACHRVAADRSPAEIRHRVEGTGRWLESRILPVPDGISLFILDVAARRPAELERAEAEASCHRLLELANDAIFVAEADSGRLIDANRRAQELTGRTLDEIRGMHQLDLHPVEESERYERLFQRAASEGAVVLRGLDVVHRDGRRIPVDISAAVVSVGGRPVLQGIFRDMSGQRAAEEALQEAAARTAAILSAAADAIITIDDRGRVEGFNPAAERMFGHLSREIVGRDVELLAPGMGEGDHARLIGDYLRTGSSSVVGLTRELEARRKDGTVFPIELTVSEVRLAERRIFTGIVRDVSERRRAAEALRASEERYRLLYEQSPVGVLLYDPELRIVECNDQFVSLLHTERDRLIGLDMGSLDDTSVLPALRSALAGERGSYQGRYRATTSSATVWISMQTAPLRAADGRVTGGVGIVEDISERVETERELRDSEERFRSLFEANPLPMWVYDLESLRFLAVNDAAVHHYGYSRDEFLAMTLHDIRPAEDVAALEASVARVRSEPGYLRSSGWRHRKKDGTLIDVEISGHTLDFTGRPAEAVLVHDVTDRLRAESALRDSEERYRDFFEDDLTADFISTADGRIVDCNPAFVRMFGFASRDEALAAPAAGLYPDRANREQLLDQVRASGSLEYYEHELRRCDGEPVHVVENVIGLFGSDGEFEGLKGYMFDVTPRKQLEEQLRRAQKMEAVGRLAGGVAHDFNNILMTIMGSAELLLFDTDDDDPRVQVIEEIRRGAERAAALTRQLLAFSRRQVLQPKVLDLNEVLQDLEVMLARLIGEHIELRVKAAPKLGAVLADPGQMEQVIVNLVVNGRDAMPDGGQLTLETANIDLDEEFARRHVDVSPGPHVVLTVSDTGSGMDEEVQSHLFEPFFTTKDRRGGTGLGLSTVYGIVRQSGGAIWVSSEVGVGTTFTIYLPRHAAAAGGDAAPIAGSVPAESRGGRETVLVVEDDPGVRDVTRRMLERFGYAVLEAPSVEDAMLVARSHRGPIPLLLTDVVMPGLSGPELATLLLQVRPEMRVLYMSGYTDDAIVRHGVLDEGVAFIEKPFTPEQLALMVRKVLDGAKRSG